MTRHKRYKHMENNKKSGKRKTNDKSKSSPGSSKRHRSTQAELAKKVTNPNLECPNCGRICAVKRTLEEHVAKCGVKKYSPAQLLKKKLQCPYDKCEFLGEYPSKLERHLRFRHRYTGEKVEKQTLLAKRKKERETSKSTPNNQIYHNANIIIPGTSASSIGLIELLEPNQFIAIQINNENPDEYHVYAKLKYNFVRNDLNEFSPILSNCDASSSHKGESNEQSSLANIQLIDSRKYLEYNAKVNEYKKSRRRRIEEISAQSTKLCPTIMSIMQQRYAVVKSLRLDDACISKEDSSPKKLSNCDTPSSQKRVSPSTNERACWSRINDRLTSTKSKAKGTTKGAVNMNSVLLRECEVVLEKPDAPTVVAAAAATLKTSNRMDVKRLKRIYNVDKSMHSRSELHPIHKNPKKHHEFVEFIPNMRKRRTRRTVAATATSATAIADNDSEASSSVGDPEPVNPNVFEPSEHGDGRIDTDTLQLIKETTFKESADDAPGPSQGAAKNMMIDKLNASRKAAAVNSRANVNDNKSGNSESDDNGWESCMGSEDGDEDDDSVANESDSKNKMIASMLMRLHTKAKSKKKFERQRLFTSVE